MRPSPPSTHRYAHSNRVFRRSTANFLRSIAASAIIACSSVVAQAQVFNINDGAIPLGSLNISTYMDTSGVGSSSEDIIGDFGLPAAPAAAAQAANILIGAYPQGLTYMQTITFNFASGNQQRAFRRNDVGNEGKTLFGTFPDAPQNGLLLRNDTMSVAGDNTPWYSNIDPTAGSAVPGNFFSGHQFRDIPTIGKGVMNGIDGLTGLLNGMPGTWSFETALVGVSVIPTNLLTGKYQVAVLEDFTWGFSWDGAGVNTIQPLAASTTVSTSFVQAFDRQGPNGAVEWDVAFTPEPGVVTLLLSFGGALIGYACLRRKAKRWG
jgi:hypothetical protein